jgi:hypothetical protein
MSKRNDSRPSIDLYFSCDIEADGPIPGPYSMSSFGLCVAGRLVSGNAYELISPDKHTFYRELKPISDDFDPEAAAVSGLDRDELIRSGADPAAAMADCAAWVKDLAGQYNAKPVFTAYPLSFDWGFMWWYFAAHEVTNPFGFSSCIDMKSMYAAKAGTTVGRSTKRWMPKHLLGSRRHTHNALDDAQGQADLFSNLMVWGGQA